jgi:hypothetical protein
VDRLWWLLFVGQALLVIALVPAAIVLVRWGDDDLRNACSIAALGAGFALGGWHVIDRRVRRPGLPPGPAEYSRDAVAIALVAWGAAVPLLSSWWDDRSASTLAIATGGAAGVVLLAHLLGLGLSRSVEQRRIEEPVAEPAGPTIGQRIRQRWRWWISGLALILIVGSVAFSVFVGFHVRDAEGNFNWDLSAVIGTATGTTLLAIGTGVLAAVTLLEVQASRQVARAASDEQAARSLPIVILEHVGISVVGGREVHVQLEVRNVGLGAAVRGALQLRYVPAATILVDELLRATSLVSGETKPITARVNSSQPIRSGWKRSDWSISGLFLDAAGARHDMIDGQTEEDDERVRVVSPPDVTL